MSLSEYGIPKLCRRRRGRRGGVLVKVRRREHRTALPSALLANVRSLDNKVDELHSRVSYQRDLKSCSITRLTETWLDDDAVHVVLSGFSMQWQDDGTVHVV